MRDFSFTSNENRVRPPVGGDRKEGCFVPQQRPIDFVSALIVEKTEKSRLSEMPPKEKLRWGATFSDHMLTVEWDADTKWGPPKIVPFQHLKLSPAATVLHYGLECFEGMKAYKSLDDPDVLRLFRPDLNMQRLKNSMDRLHMSTDDLDFDGLVSCIKSLVSLDKDWIPHGEGYSLYLRPTVISTDPCLGAWAPTKLLLYVIASPVGPYYVNGFKPVKLTADVTEVRAWPGGTGAHKLGGNYGPTVAAYSAAIASGYDQVLWLYGDNDEITEVGAMNVFFLMDNADTKRRELVTAPLDRGDILPGVTRRSVLELAKSWGEDNLDVVERFVTMPEVRDAAKEGRLVEAFGTGTAAVVSPIERVRYRGEDVIVPAVGDVTKRVWDELTAIQYGKAKGPDGWSIVI